MGHRREPADRAQVEDPYAAGESGAAQPAELLVDRDDVRRPFMRAGGSEEVAVGEVDADQADMRRAHVDREAQGDVGRDDAVVQHIGVREVGAVFRAECEADDVGVRHVEVGELREQVSGPRRPHEVEAVAFELRWRIDDDEVVGLKQAPDIVDADRDEAIDVLQ